MLNEAHVENTGLIESLKNAMQPEVIANKIGMDKNVLIDIGIYGTIGFIIGFLLKKYSEYFIAAILLIVGVFVLQQFNYVSFSINTPKIHQMLGLPSSSVVGDRYGVLLFEWMKANVAGSASLIVGFLIGLKIG
jgi:uncharacterized membrane protein (Fun14 family)